MFKILKKNKAQSAVEYMLLLAVVVSIVLVGFRSFIKQTNTASNQFFNNISEGIMGKPTACGDGYCDPVWEAPKNHCCLDCGC